MSDIKERYITHHQQEKHIQENYLMALRGKESLALGFVL